MGQAGTQYRELAFSIGCPIKTKGEQALNKSQQYAADGRRTPFPWLLRRHSKVAAVLSVSWCGFVSFGWFGADGLGRKLAVKPDGWLLCQGPKNWRVAGSAIDHRRWFRNRS